MTLLATVAGRLREHEVPFALIGAAALAVHGLSRSTADVDLLAVDSRCLEPASWTGLDRDGLGVEIRRGDASDPLAGLVRFHAPDENAGLDLVVGWGGWQADVLARAFEHPFGPLTVPVATRADLALLKLYAGGTLDEWDLRRLVEMATPEEIAQIETGLDRLPARCRRLWNRVRSGDTAG